MTAPQATDLIGQLEAACEKATGGVWQVAGTRHTGNLKIGRGTRLHFVGPDGDAVAAVFFDMKTGQGLADAHLIALMCSEPNRNAILAALKRVPELEAAVRKARDTFAGEG